MHLHWHGDTFDIPEQAAPLCSSGACQSQGFGVDEKIIGLQFHPEMTATGIAALIENCRPELTTAPWIQAEEQIIASERFIEPANQTMEKLLEHCALQAQ